MFNFFKKDKGNVDTKQTTGVNWSALNDTKTLEEIKVASKSERIMIFKHSIRCAISSGVLNRLERSWNQEEMQGLKPYYLDLIRNRSLSNQVAQEFSIMHESPQVLIIENGQCIYHASHMGINYADLSSLAQ